MAIVMKDSISRKVFNLFNYTFLAILAASCIIPFMNLLAVSLSDKIPVEANRVGLWPVGFNLSAYEHVVGNKAFILSFWNSIKLCFLSITTHMLMTVITAFPMSRNDSEFKGRKIYAWFMVVTILFGGGMLPTYLVVKETGLINTIWSLIIPGMVPVFNVFMLMHFFRGIPREVEESSFIDGASYMQTLWRILLPMATPALATLVLLNFVGTWNEFVRPMIYIYDRSKYPLQAYLQSIIMAPDLEDRSREEIQKFATMNYRTINAAQIFTSMIPVMVFYPFLQKYFTKGIVIGSVKG